jgi:hypothetical protein
MGYAIRNPWLFYCQGMNNVAVYFIKNGYS